MTDIPKKIIGAGGGGGGGLAVEQQQLHKVLHHLLNRLENLILYTVEVLLLFKI